jgi:hypothetical protein
MGWRFNRKLACRRENDKYKARFVRRAYDKSIFYSMGRAGEHIS